MKKGYIFTLAIAFALALASITSCNTAPAVQDNTDSTSISATVDTTYLDVDTTAVDTSSFK